MAAPPFDLNEPSPTATQYGANIDQIRDNLVNLVMYAAGNGGRLCDWDSAFTYVTDELTEVVLTNKTYTGVKIKITYSYTGTAPDRVLNKESYYFDKDLGAGYELVSNGVLTYGYSSGNLVTVTAGNS